MSDNTAGLSTETLAAIDAESTRYGAAYGNDETTRLLDKLYGEVFGAEVRVFPVSTGTAANGLALACVSRPQTRILCHQRAHLLTDEAWAPEQFAACRMVPIPGEGGLLDPEAVEGALSEPVRLPAGLPISALSLAQTAETGRCYSLAQLRRIGALAGPRGVKVHMDGARLANALVHLDATPAAMTWGAGVDVLSLGATKNGALAAEAVIFFDLAAAERFAPIAKRFGHTLSKSRFVSVQLAAYVREGRWLAHAAHGNRLARNLAEGLAALPNVSQLNTVDANILFVRMPRTMVTQLQEAGAGFFFGADGPEHATVRLVTNFQTTADEVERFVDLAAAHAKVFK